MICSVSDLVVFSQELVVCEEVALCCSLTLWNISMTPFSELIWQRCNNQSPQKQRSWINQHCFLIRNRFHVILGVPSPEILFKNKFIQDWGCVELRVIDLLFIKICWSIQLRRFVDNNYLYKDVCKFESSQREEAELSRWFLESFQQT